MELESNPVKRRSSSSSFNKKEMNSSTSHHDDGTGEGHTNLSIINTFLSHWAAVIIMLEVTTTVSSPNIFHSNDKNMGNNHNHIL